MSDDLDTLDWDGETDTQGGGGSFYSIKDGLNVLRVASKPVKMMAHFIDTKDATGKKVSNRFNSPGAGDPLIQAGISTPGPRYGIKVLVCAEKTGKTKLVDRVPALMEIGPLIFKEIQKHAKNEDYGNPFNYDFKITKSGSGPTNTKYEVVARPPGSCEPWSKDIEAHVSSLDLATAYKPSTIEEIENFIANKLNKVGGSDAPDNQVPDDDLFN